MTNLANVFEELQAASMDYITDKGVEKQSTQRGIDRMDAALDICRISAAGMDYFMSKERAKEVQDFQKKHFDVYFAYKDADKEVKPVTSVYEAKEEKKIEAEMDDGAMSR